MAPTESSSSDNSNRKSSNFLPNCGLLLSSAKFDPFLRSLLSSGKPNSTPPNILLIGDHLKSSIFTATDKCLRFLHSFASQNALLQKALSLPHDFYNFSHRIHCRKYTNVNNPKWAHNFAAVLPEDSVAGLVVTNGIINFLNIYNTVLIVRLVLTWFPNAPPSIVSPLRIIPPLGGTLDLSPILAFLVLNAFSSTAAALPAELPATESNQQITFSSFSNLTSLQKKWMRRHHGGNRTKS